MGDTNICMSCFKAMSEFEVCPHCGWVRCMQPKDAYHLHPGTILKQRYIVGVVLGCGGFGITYKAYDATLNITVAIKEYYPVGLVNRIPGEKEIIIFSGDKKEQYKAGIMRFLAEARNMAKFNNYPHIVNVFDFFEENHTAYIVMEYLDGKSLKKYLADNGEKLSFEDTYAILEPVMRAVEEIHKAKLLHRDISPDNIHITTDNRVKLYDFGAARLANAEQELTLSIVIKVGYTPPEQYRSKSKQGAFTDIYALGATFYRCVTGILPEESIDRQMKDTLKKPSALGIKLPLYAEKSIMKALALKEGLRFNKVNELRLAILNKRKVDFPEVEHKKRKKMQLIAAALGALLFVTALGGMRVYQNIVNPTVQPTTITVWVPGEEASANVLAMQDIGDSFEKENNGFEVEINAINAEQYREEIQKAGDSDTLPCLYRADLASEEDVQNCVPLTYLLNTLDSRKYYFLQDYSKYFKDKTIMPAGCVLPVVYYNSYIMKELGIQAENSYENISQLIEAVSDKGGSELLAISSDVMPCIQSNADKATYEELLKIELPTEAALAAFADEKACFYIGLSTDIRAVQESLPGYFGVSELNGNSITGYFKDMWCVSQGADKNTQYASMMFINYLLSDYAQNVLHIQNDNAIPLSKISLEEYIAANGDLQALTNAIKTATMFGQEHYWASPAQSQSISKNASSAALKSP